MAEEINHLKEGFDPNSYTTAQLRKVFVYHNIQYSSSDSKQALVTLFKEEIAPRSKQLLDEYKEKVKNFSDEGFVNITNEQKPTKSKKKSRTATPIRVDTENEPEIEVTKVRSKKGKSKSSRSSSSKITSPEPEEEEEVDAKPASRSSSRRGGAAVPDSLFDLDDSVLNVRKTSNKTKKPKSKKTISSAKKEAVKEDLDKKLADRSTSRIETSEEPTPSSSKITTPKQEQKASFSDENVFQSFGSSTKKRKHELDDEEGNDDNDSSSVSTNSFLKKVRRKKTPTDAEKSLFDDSESDLEFLKSSSKKDEVPSSSGNSTVIITPKKVVASPKITKPKSAKKETPIKSSSSPGSARKSYKSIDEEIEDFDKEQQRINSKNSQPQVDPELAKSLGITIQGFQPPVITPSKTQLKKNLTPARDESTPMIPKKSPATTKRTPRKISSEVSTPRTQKSGNSGSNSSSSKRTVTPKSASHKSTPPRRSPLITKSALTPKPRLISLGSQKYETDDEEEEEEEPKVVETKKDIDANPIVWSKVVFSLFFWILIVGSGLFGLWYHDEKYSVGYCGQEIDQTTFGDSEYPILQTVGSFLDDNFKPACLTCPLHARCFPNLEIGCYEDFMEFKPWYDFIVPGFKKCVPDTKKAEKLEIMIDVALDLLRSKNAAIKCGKGYNDEESGIKLDDLHDLLLTMKAPYITVDEFEELWARSVIEIQKEPDIVVRQKRSSGVSTEEFTFDFNNTETEKKETYQIFRSTSLSNISLKCQIHNSVVGNLAEHRFRILSIVLILLIFQFIRFKYNRYQKEMNRIDGIYEEVLKKLKNQYKLSQENSDAFPYIGSNQLRDLILSNIDNLNQRLTIWRKVVDKVERNSNVSHQIIEHHGEVMKVWQWISDDV